MSFIRDMQRYIPEYYDGMHRDGFKEWEIQVAIQKMQDRIAQEFWDARQKRQDPIPQVNIKSEIKIK